jgi:hypothetical protein
MAQRHFRYCETRGARGALGAHAIIAETARLEFLSADEPPRRLCLRPALFSRMSPEELAQANTLSLPTLVAICAFARAPRGSEVIRSFRMVAEVFAGPDQSVAMCATKLGVSPGALQDDIRIFRWVTGIDLRTLGEGKAAAQRSSYVPDEVGSVVRKLSRSQRHALLFLVFVREGNIR